MALFGLIAFNERLPSLCRQGVVAMWQAGQLAWSVGFTGPWGFVYLFSDATSYPIFSISSDAQMNGPTPLPSFSRIFSLM